MRIGLGLGLLLAVAIIAKEGVGAVALAFVAVGSLGAFWTVQRLVLLFGSLR